MKDGWSIYRIAKHLGRPYNTVKNEIKRGTVSLYADFHPEELVLAVFHNLYRLTMVFLFTFFAYDSAKLQSSKAKQNK